MNDAAIAYQYSKYNNYIIMYDVKIIAAIYIYIYIYIYSPLLGGCYDYDNTINLL